MNMRSIYSQVCLLHHCLRAVARRCVHSMAAFLAPFPSAPARSVGNATCNKWRMGDVAVVGTGYALLDALKGVVIGPTVNEIVAALAGGTVGVMGTIIALEVGRQRAKERKQCPYCRGTGKLPCGECYTLGSVPSSKAVGAQEGCVLCQERGFLMCNHCEGEGRLIPIEYERAIRAQYEDYVYYNSNVDDYYQDGPPYV